MTGFGSFDNSTCERVLDPLEPGDLRLGQVVWWFREQEEMRMLRGVVYMTKSSGPRTEPWGTPQEDVCQEERSVTHFDTEGTR